MTQALHRSLGGFRIAALAVLVAVLAGVAAFQLHQRLGGGSKLAGLTRQEQAAVDAAKQEAINIQTYRLKSFDSDFAAAVAGMTPQKATEWQARKSALKSGMTKQKTDLGATVSGAGLVSLRGDSAVVLVSSDSQRSDSKGKLATFAQNRFQVTMKLVKGAWMMDDFQSVSL
jgi:hypothetical protein